MIYIPLIDLPEAQGGEIVFNSRSPEAMDVTPVFYRRNGETVLGDPVQIQPAEIRYVNIQDLLPERYRHEKDWGGFGLAYYGANRQMWSQFRFLGVNGGANVDEFFTVKEESRSAVHEAAWWMPDKSEAIIALGNISDAPTAATVSFGNGHVRRVNLQAHATELIRENHRNEGTEAVKIDVDGPAGSIVPTGIITTKDGSFNSVIRFYDPTKAKQPNLYANGFRVKGTTAHMVVKNTTQNSIAVMPRIIPLSGTGTLALPQVSLAANETKEVDLSSLVSAGRNRPDLDVVSVEITNWAAPGSVIGSIYATDQRTGAEYDVPLRDSGPIRSMTGAYPWKVSDDFRSIAYVTNISDEQAEFVAELGYAGGKYTILPRKLQPRETAVFDIEKIRDEQKKDDTGHTLPTNISQGQFKWAVRGVTNGKIVLIGRTEMVSKTQDISSSYSCPMDCGPYYDAYANLPGEMSIGDSASGQVMETASWNYGYTMGPYATSGNWEMDNQISTLDSSEPNTTMITATDAGIANVTITIGWQQRYDWDGLNCVDLGSYLEQAAGELLNAPIVVAVLPGTAAPGTLVPIAITGFGFHNDATVSTGNGGVQVTESRVINSNLMVATLAIAPNALGGIYGVTVTSGGRNSLIPGVFRVRIPHHLEVVSDNGNTQLLGGCQDGSTPRIRLITFKVVDSGGNGVGVVTLSEQFTSLSFNTCRADGLGPNPDGCGYNASGSDTFTDVITVNCTTVGGSCGYNITDVWRWCPIGGSPQPLATLTETVHYNQITVNGNTAGFSPGSTP